MVFLFFEVLILLLFTLSILISLFSIRFEIATFIFFSVLISPGISFFSLPLLSSEFSLLYKISNAFIAILSFLISLKVLLESWLAFFSSSSLLNNLFLSFLKAEDIFSYNDSDILYLSSPSTFLKLYLYSFNSNISLLNSFSKLSFSSEYFEYIFL